MGKNTSRVLILATSLIFVSVSIVLAQFKSKGLGSIKWGSSIAQNALSTKNCLTASIDTAIYNCNCDKLALIFTNIQPSFKNHRFNKGKLFEINYDVPQTHFADIILAIEKEFGKATLYQPEQGKTLIDGVILYQWNTVDTKIGLLYRDREKTFWLNIRTKDSSLWPNGSDFEFTIEDLATK